MPEIKDEKLLKKISIELKKLREDSGMSQRQFYMETNIHIGRIESGKQNVSISTISFLCKHFGVSLAEFFKTIEGK